MNKQKIMKVLLSSENDLTKEDISWAALNIPNESTKELMAYDHDKSSVFEACGITDEIADDAVKEYKKIYRECERQSQVVEAILTVGSQALVRSIIIRGMQSIHKQATEDASEISDLIKDFIKKHKK